MHTVFIILFIIPGRGTMMERSESSMTQPLDAGDAGKPASRRRVLKVFGVSALTLAVGSVLPDRWSRPILSIGAIPVHAQTSGEEVSSAEAPEETCNISISLRIEDFVNGGTITSGTATPSGTLVVYIATISPAPAAGAQVTFYFANGNTVTEEVLPGDDYAYIAAQPIDIDAASEGEGTYQEVYATHRCGRSDTWNQLVGPLG